MCIIQNWCSAYRTPYCMGFLSRVQIRPLPQTSRGDHEMAAYQSAAELAKSWKSDPRWKGVTRPYSAEDVVRLRGTLHIEHTLARLGAECLWEMLTTEEYVNALGAVTGNQAVQMVAAGLKAIYVSGWQVAADANNAGQMYPDQSLYPADSVPNLCRRLNNALIRADQIHHSEGKNGMNWFVPLIADAEAGFGGTLNAFELMKAMIEAGAACVHFEDQLSSAKKCGHLGGKVLVPTQEAVQKLIAARLAADVLGLPTLVLARTDANSAHLLTADIDPYDRIFLTGERTVEGFYGIHGGLDSAIARGLAYAPYSDLIWCETSEPNLKEAERFADAVHAKFPGKMRAYRDTGMTAYSRVQEKEFAREFSHGYSAVKHQRFVGTGYFDEVTQVIASGKSSLSALEHSTEAEQFAEIKVPAQMIEIGQDPSCRPILGECPLTCEHEHEHIRSGNVSAND